MTALLAVLSRRTYFRYIAASGGALAIDLLLFMALLETGMLPAAASALGYSLGILAHWLVSSRAVFADGVAARGEGRNVQKALFIGSALIGLAITTVIVGLGDLMGLDPRLAKLAAIAVSFQATYVLRKRVVFAQ